MRFLAALPIALMTLVGCGDQCSNHVLVGVSSPSGLLRAVVFSRECGATVGFNTQVSVVAATEQPADSGNVAVWKGAVPLTLRWQSDTELIVSGGGSAEHFKREVVVGVVRVRYD